MPLSILDSVDITLVAPESTALYTGGYDPVLVALSVGIAIFASYAALLVSQYVATTTTARSRRPWLAVGGLCLGAGIWTMHFVGMLAFNLPCSTGYDTTLTLLSMVPGILASTLALEIISRDEVSPMRLATGGLLIGAGIGTMHYSGMAAMRLDGLIRYDAELFALSLLVAVALATLALWIKFRLQAWQGRWRAGVPVASAVVMGMAVSGMHYTAMAAAYFVRGDDMNVADALLGPTFLASIVLVVTAVIIVVTIVATHLLYLRASRKAEADLRVAATAFESQEGMVITDAAGVILRVNRSFTEMTGYAAGEALGRKISLLKSDRHDAAFYEAMWESIRRTGAWQGEVWDRRKTGEVYPKWLTITAVKGRDGTVTHYVGAHTDITQRKAAEDEIKHLAFYDPLTRLPNRRLLLDRLQRALAASARSGMHGALLFIDLDHFKTLNDTLGHDKGDLLLQQVAERLARSVRTDDTVARLGGDEFVAMLESLGATAREAATRAEAIAEKIRAALNRPYDCAGHEHHGTQSIGVTLFGGDHSESLEEVLKRADLAMYQAKAAGRNTVRFFDPEMQAAVNARAALEADLREALRGDQLCLYYQVQVDSGGRPTGAEALVRWRHPARGLVPPGVFIPLAEETGLILPLGLRVLEVACAQLAAWAGGASTAHLTVAVNVSARQFRHPDFVEQVVAALDRHRIEPQRLKLELTESILLHDMDDVVAKMTALKARGVGFALDDFGTGYSSLSYLKRLPLEQLKIDQSFVRDLLTDPNDAAIAKTIVDLASSMGLAVIAEGVETEAQRHVLARSGCRAYQGYLFGKPLPPGEFERYLTPDRTIDAAGSPSSLPWS